MLPYLIALNATLALVSLVFLARLIPAWRRAWTPANIISVAVILACVGVLSQRYYRADQRHREQAEARQYYHAALDAQQRGDLQAAERDFARSLAIRPRQPDVRRDQQRMRTEQSAPRRQVRAPARVDPSAAPAPGPPAAKPPPAKLPTPSRRAAKPPAKAPPKAPPKPRAQEPSPFEIRHYDLSVRLQPDKHALTATAVIAIQARRRIDHELPFSLNPEFTPTRVLLDDRPADFRHQNDRLSVRPARALRKGQQATVTIAYQRRSQSARLGAGGQISEAGTFLMMEGRWYPASGELDFRCPARVSITVPRGLSAVSIGALQSLRKTETTSTFVWETKRPAAMLALAVNHYVLQSRWVGKLKLTAYTTAGRRAGGKRMLAEAAKIVRYYSRQFGPYPFEKLAIVEIPQFPGGYGSTSFVMLLDRSFDAPKTPREFLAHEIAHQWWGNSVSPRGYGAAWLTEAFANYSAWMYLADDAGDQRVLRKRVRQGMDTYWRIAQRTGDQAIGKEDPYRPTAAHQAIIYEKGAVILHSLRREMGDAAFRLALRQFADQHRYGAARISDFEQVVSRIAGKPLAWFFDQWLGRTGRMEFSYHFRNVPLTPSRQQVTLVIDQPAPPWRATVDVDLQVGNDARRETVTLSGRHQEVSFEVPEPVTAVAFDPENWVLMRAKWVVPPESPASEEAAR